MGKENQSSGHLAISIKGSTPNESNKEQRIAKKLKKIEQLNKQIEKITNTINVARKLYDKHCRKYDEKLLLSKEQLIVKLYQRYQQKGFTNWQKTLIETKLVNEIDDLVSSGYKSETILNIHSEISKLMFADMGDDDKEFINDFTQEFFKDMGVDMGDFNFEDLNDPDFIKRFEEQQSEKFREDHKESYNADKEEKHIDQKEKVKTTNNDFQKLYRDLVKKAHPDLVVDPIEKEIREEWMKELSKAWEERNYYELLLLQKKISKDDSMDILIDSLQVDPLVKELNKAINKLESDKYHLKRFDPETSFYYENFNARSEKGILKKIKEHKADIEIQIEEVEDETLRLKSQKTTKELLKEIRDSQSVYNEDVFDIFGF